MISHFLRILSLLFGAGLYGVEVLQNYSSLVRGDFIYIRYACSLISYLFYDEVRLALQFVS